VPYPAHDSLQPGSSFLRGKAAIVLSDRSPAFENVATELENLLDQPSVYNLAVKSQSPEGAFSAIAQPGGVTSLPCNIFNRLRISCDTRRGPSHGLLHALLWHACCIPNQAGLQADEQVNRVRAAHEGGGKRRLTAAACPGADRRRPPGDDVLHCCD
jgi:hypothetical protein